MRTLDYSSVLPHRRTFKLVRSCYCHKSFWIPWVITFGTRCQNNFLEGEFRKINFQRLVTNTGAVHVSFPGSIYEKQWSPPPPAPWPVPRGFPSPLAPWLQNNTSWNAQAGIPKSGSAPTRRSPQVSRGCRPLLAPRLQAGRAGIPQVRLSGTPWAPETECLSTCHPGEFFLLRPSWAQCSKPTTSSSQVIISLLQQEKPFLTKNMRNKGRTIISDITEFSRRETKNKY